MRITGGNWKGRELRTPPESKSHLGLRPTLARTRQALFNSLQAHIPGARVLDLFAGSGALGFEALSRDADHVTFVESDRDALRAIRENIHHFKCESTTQVIAGEFEKKKSDILARAPFDVILADPPYGGHWEEKIWNKMHWAELLVPEGIFVLEWSAEKGTLFPEGLPERMPPGSGDLLKTREHFYGTTGLTTFTHRPSKPKGI